MEQLTAAQQAAELNKKNLFATYNHIEAEFVEPDHAIFKLCLLYTSDAADD